MRRGTRLHTGSVSLTSGPALLGIDAEGLP